MDTRPTKNISILQGKTMTLLIICTIIAIIGAVYVSRGNSKTPNYLWSIANMGFIIHSMNIKEYELVALFCVYEIISIYGIYNHWSKK